MSCSKSSELANIDAGVHNINPGLVGKWMWTEGSDIAYYSDNGVYTGSAYGLATQYTVKADGSAPASIIFTTQGDRQCFQVTASNGTMDTFFKMN